MNVHSRSNNNERNILTRNEIILTRNEIIDCIAEKIVSVITQVSKETKLYIHPNLWRPNFSFTY